MNQRVESTVGAVKCPHYDAVLPLSKTMLSILTSPDLFYGNPSSYKVGSVAELYICHQVLHFPLTVVQLILQHGDLKLECVITKVF
jgi:hypothetical protein